MEKVKRAMIFIDGSNFYFKMKSLRIKNLRVYDYRGLCRMLAKGRQVVNSGYYIGVVRAELSDVKGQQLRRAQIDLFNHLRDQKILIHKGYLMKSGGKYHEKGVDVKIATDLLVGAYENLYDDAIVISSDTDLIPAFSKVKQLGKGVEYIGFGHQPTLALQKFATVSRLLVLSELEKFCAAEK